MKRARVLVDGVIHEVTEAAGGALRLPIDLQESKGWINWLT
jgi:hypothetical protein